MARDNGSRGSYRHIDATEPTAQKQQQPISEETADKASSDKEPNPKAMMASKDVQYIEGHNTDHLSDHASDLLNARFPPMTVPGPTLSRHQTQFSTQQRQSYDWKDVSTATAFYGSAAVGFSVIMWDGLKAIGGMLLEAGNQLIHEGLLLLGY